MQISRKRFTPTRKLSANLFSHHDEFSRLYIKENKSVKLNMSYVLYCRFISYCYSLISRCKGTTFFLIGEKKFVVTCINSPQYNILPVVVRWLIQVRNAFLYWWYGSCRVEYQLSHCPNFLQIFKKLVRKNGIRAYQTTRQDATTSCFVFYYPSAYSLNHR